METVKNPAADLPSNAEWQGSQRVVPVSIRSTNRCEKCNKIYK